MRQSSFGLRWWLIASLIVVLFSDFQISNLDSQRELALMVAGLVKPDWFTQIDILPAVLNTLAFALQGVALGSIAGFVFSLFLQCWPVRVFCASIRAVHELFWALLFLQITGLSPLTGVLAIAIPYAGIFAKVYGELMEQEGIKTQRGLEHSGFLNLKFFAHVSTAWPSIKTYTAYRLECALRSSIVLGFIGLPTLGFYLESAFSSGDYAESAALLYLLIALIGTLRFWLKAHLVPFYILASLIYLPPVADFSVQMLWQFLSYDLVPAPLRSDSNWGSWITSLSQQVTKGAVLTVGLAYLAMLVSGLLALLQFPLISKHFLQSSGRFVGHCLLVVQRSIPELVLAYIFLLVLGPSWIPAILALALHNGAIVAHLLGRYSFTLKLRADAVSGPMRYFYEVLPRLQQQFLAFLFYRWEVIQRETVILGILGIHTLGFYVDSAFEELRFDRALVLITATALLNIGLDIFTTHMRRRLHLPSIPEQL